MSGMVPSKTTAFAVLMAFTHVGEAFLQLGPATLPRGLPPATTHHEAGRRGSPAAAASSRPLEPSAGDGQGQSWVAQALASAAPAGAVLT
eukprot:CAMPEP_0115501786 /NCGR_PEP_ID=MMETSP0271-20121206/68584_1 /TAXON_ID=71861 /ORGANISM="Scrippsiella trochoidea, Strain CCMP3099" /LENGTH=89 /DNA_ID=CAMNT_0002930745 /DNA_START=68 /DNA_END=333 /DNA_ORIENTATION=+